MLLKTNTGMYKRNQEQYAKLLEQTEKEVYVDKQQKCNFRPKAANHVPYIELSLAIFLRDKFIWSIMASLSEALPF